MADSNNVVTLAHREQKPVSEVSEVSDVYTPSTYPLLLSKRVLKGLGNH
jgi:hypothetical protein